MDIAPPTCSALQDAREQFVAATTSKDPSAQSAPPTRAAQEANTEDIICTVSVGCVAGMACACDTARTAPPAPALVQLWKTEESIFSTAWASSACFASESSPDVVIRIAPPPSRAEQFTKTAPAMFTSPPTALIAAPDPEV